MAKQKAKKKPLQVQTIYYFIQDAGDGSAFVRMFTDRKKAQKVLDKLDYSEQLSDGSVKELDLEVDSVTGKILTDLTDGFDDEGDNGSDEPNE